MGAHSDGIGKGTTFFFDLPVYSSHSTSYNGNISDSDQKLSRDNGNKWRRMLSFGELLHQSGAASAVSHRSQSILGTPSAGNAAAAYLATSNSSSIVNMETPNQNDNILSIETTLKPSDSPRGNVDFMSRNSSSITLFQQSTSPGRVVVCSLDNVKLNETIRPNISH